MTRRLVGILVLAVAAVGAAGAAVPSRQIPLASPTAQNVAIEAVKLAGSAAAAPLRLSSAAAPQATALVARKTNTIFAIVVNRTGGKASIQLGSVPGSTSITVKSLTDVGTASPQARSTLPRSIARVLGWNPLTKPSDLTAPGVTVEIYDSRHPAGRPLASELAVRSAEDAAQLLISPNISVRDDLYEQIDETSACILGRVVCGSYVFSFRGLRETIVRSDQPKFHLTTHYTGRTCGRTLLGQPWTIVTQSGSGRPVSHKVDLAKANIVFTTFAKVKVGSGSAIHKLGPQPGAFPLMEALVDSTGVWSSDAGGQTVPVSVTKLAAGKSC
jgi:hypothetical protein